MVFSHCGIPAEAGVPFPSAGRCPLPAGAGGGGTGYRGRPGPVTGGDGAAGWPGLRDREHGPGTDHVRIGADDPPVGRVKSRQPPRTANRAAMPASVSPGCTTYLAAGRLPGTDAAATLSVLATVTSVVLLAMRVFAWAGRTDPFPPAATMISRMHQASTTHADFVDIRTVLSLSFQGDQRRTLQARTPRTRTVRKERT